MNYLPISMENINIPNWVFTLLSSEMYGLSVGHGLTLSPMENYQVFLKIF